MLWLLLFCVFSCCGFKLQYKTNQYFSYTENDPSGMSSYFGKKTSQMNKETSRKSFETNKRSL